MTTELVFLGTSAAVGWPADYCTCGACEEIRRRGSKNVRTRSALRIGEFHQIDCGPDNHLQVLQAGLTMSRIEHILFTHSHADHISMTHLLSRHMSKSAEAETVTLYANPQTMQRIRELMEVSMVELPQNKRDLLRQLFRLETVEFGTEFHAGEISVLPLRANHMVLGNDEYASNYLMRMPGGRTLLYAVDTGWPSDEVWNALSGMSLDMLVMDCTFAGLTDREPEPESHLDCRSFRAVCERLLKVGAINENTVVYATHIGPHQGLLHEELVDHFSDTAPRVEVAYDGLRTTL